MKGKIVDYTGIEIGNITVISFVRRSFGKSYWNCKCDCGNEFISEVHNLKQRIEKGGQKYCKKCRSSSILIHGDSKKTYKNGKARLYGIWEGMRYRCEKQYASHYESYGGKGIKVCDEWQDYSTFKEWALSHGYENNLTIDRIDSNGNYSPQNCRWATKKEQANNTSQVKKYLYKGKVFTISELSELTGISHATLVSRVHKGWPIERAIETPHRTKAKRCILKL